MGTFEYPPIWMKPQGIASGGPNASNYPTLGGGGGGDMEARLAKLETTTEYIQRDVAEVRSDVKDIRERFGRLETKVEHLPGKGFVVTTTLLALAVVSAIIGFQGQIQAFLGLAPIP